VEVEDAASELTRRLQDGLLREVVDAARSGGRGALGVQAVTEALREGRVDRLLISRGFREREADFADRFAGSAFEHGGEVEELSGEAAEHLDAEGEGVAARLRYTT
jgi:peptide subunit release factor 1 (eRF1)